MALIVCPSCQKQYSDTLNQCPHCKFTPTVFICPECSNLCSLSDPACFRCGYVFEGQKRMPASMELIKNSYQDCLKAYNGANSLREWSALAKAFETLGDYKDSQEKAGECLSSAKAIEQEEKRAALYSEAQVLFKSASSSKEMQKAVDSLASLGNYRDAKEKLPGFTEKLETIKARELETEKESLYAEVTDQIENASTQTDWKQATEKLSGLGEYKDAPMKLEYCRQQLNTIAAQKKKKTLLICSAAAAVIILVVLAKLLIIPAVDYKNGSADFNAGNYSKAADLFQAAGNYKDAPERAKTAIKAKSYKDGEDFLASKQYEDSVNAFKAADDYKDAKEKINAVAITAIQSKEYQVGIDALSDYKDDNSIGYVNYARGMLALDSKKYTEAEGYFNKALGIEDGAEQAKRAYFRDAETDYAYGNLNSALEKYKMLPNDYALDNVLVADRLNILDSHSAFVDMCGKWKASGNCTIKVRQTGSYGYWNEWTADNPDPLQYLEVRCIINSDGTVNVLGKLEYYRYTTYSPVSSGVEGTTDNKEISLSNLTSPPNGVAVAPNLTLTFSNGSYKAYYSKSDNTEDVYFTYLYTSSYTYGSLVEQY